MNEILENLKFFVYSLLLHFYYFVSCICKFALKLVLPTTNAELTSFFKSKTILITGASSGIGKAIALKLVQLGANVVLVSRSIEKLDDCARQCSVSIPKDGSNIVVVAPLDVGSHDEFPAYVSNLSVSLKDKGISGINMIINNAGVSSRGLALNTSKEALQRIMDVNFYGPVLLTKEILKTFQESLTNIVLISSVQGKLGLPERTGYAASKHALQGYFDGLRGELKKHGAGQRPVQVNIISPGYVKTSLSLNALNPDGSSYGKLDDNTLNGMPSEQLADRALEAIVNSEPDVIVADAKARIAVVAKSLVPEILATFLNAKKH